MHECISSSDFSLVFAKLLSDVPRTFLQIIMNPFSSRCQPHLIYYSFFCCCFEVCISLTYFQRKQASFGCKKNTFRLPSISFWLAYLLTMNLLPYFTSYFTICKNCLQQLFRHLHLINIAHGVLRNFRYAASYRHTCLECWLATQRNQQFAMDGARTGFNGRILRLGRTS